MSRAEDDDIERLMAEAARRETPAAKPAPTLIHLGAHERAAIRDALGAGVRTLADIGMMTTCSPRLRAAVQAWSAGRTAALAILDTPSPRLPAERIEALRTVLRDGILRCDDAMFLPRLLPAQRKRLPDVAAELCNAVDLLVQSDPPRKARDHCNEVTAL